MGPTNGYSGKILIPQIGQIAMAMLQLRDSRFYPQAQEGGARSARLDLVLAVM